MILSFLLAGLALLPFLSFLPRPGTGNSPVVTTLTRKSVNKSTEAYPTLATFKDKSKRKKDKSMTYKLE